MTDTSRSTSVDLNSDVGEGFGPHRGAPDAELLGLVSSANVACGFHAGDPRIMDATVRTAVECGVTVGAHVSYPDLVGFGRRHIRVSRDELVTDVLYQLGALEAFCRRYGTGLRYVKPHGALYNDLADDPELADGLADALLAYGGGLAALVLAGSPAVEVLAGRGVRVVREGFADRGYTAGGRLVARSQPGAVLSDPDEVGRRGARLAAGQPVESADGGSVTVGVDSICVHSDSPGAVALATALRQALDAAGVAVRPFA